MLNSLKSWRVNTYMQKVSLLRGSLVSAVIFIAYSQPPVNQTRIVTWKFQSAKSTDCSSVYNGMISNPISVRCSKENPTKYKQNHFQLAQFWVVRKLYINGTGLPTGAYEVLLQIKICINWFHILILTEVLSGKHFLIATVISDENWRASL